ncbi:MAG: hypothetical protein IT379_40460, partial [Deltaproteobacteria bacterium]|nr:hypothetical protein [Deltaproteobacteria bacterium]
MTLRRYLVSSCVLAAALVACGDDPLPRMPGGDPGGTPPTPGSTPGTTPGSTPGTTPGSTPGTPGSTPGTPGSTPGTPGSTPGTPGSTPGTPGSTPTPLPTGEAIDAYEELICVPYARALCGALDECGCDGRSSGPDCERVATLQCLSTAVSFVPSGTSLSGIDLAAA